MLLLLSLFAPLLLMGIVDDDDGSDNITEDGTDGDDTLTGGEGNDLLRGLDGDDDLTGGNGDDTLFGFEGDDLLIGNNGNDMLCSGDGDDIISGNRGSDLIEAQEGDDWASGDYSNDQVFGNEGEDTVIGGRGMDTVDGGTGDDVVFGGILQGVPLSADELGRLSDGESLADILGEQGLEIDMREDDRMDVLRGGEGDDTLFIGNGDIANGGEGDDSFNLMFDDDNSDRPLAQINDFNAEDDTISIVFDAPLDVTEVTIETNGNDAIVMANGEQLAVVTGAAGTLTAADVSVVTEDSVAGLFDPNAVAA